MNEELKVIISAEVNKLKQGVQNAKKQISNFKEQVKKASADVDKHFKAIGQGINNALKGVGTAVAGAAAALLGVSAATEEYRNNQAKLQTAFEAAGSDAKTAEKTYNSLYRVMGDSGAATEAAQSLARLNSEEKALGEYTTTLTGIYAVYGDGMPIETIAESIAETAACGTVTGDLSRALVEAGVSEDAFNEKLQACATQQEREALIRSTLNGLYGDAAAKYEENNAAVLAQNEANAKLQGTLAALGGAVAPIVTAFTSFANDALAVVVPYVQQLAEQYAPLLQQALQGVSEVLGTVMGYLRDNWETVLTVAAVIGGIATAIGLYNTVAAIKAAMDAAQVTTLWGLVAAYAAQAAAMIVAIAPYLLIVAAIAAVIAIIVLCVKHWDEIKAKVAEVWAAMVAKIEEIAGKIKEKVSAMVESVKNFFGNMANGISEKASAAKEAAVNKFNEIKSGISEKINGAKTAVSTAVLNIVSNFREKFNSAKSTVLGIFDSIKSGISDKINAAKTAVGNVIEAIKGFFNFKFTLPSIPKPSFGITPTGWVLGDLLKGVIPKLSIKWNALGGVFDKPTLFSYGGSVQGIGEDGAEAVVPLEKNTKWLDVLADKLAARQGATPIVLQIDGKTFAQTTVDSINQLTRQRGSLALNLV